MMEMTQMTIQKKKRPLFLKNKKRTKSVGFKTIISLNLHF